jgi:hypothetical protein
MKIILTIFILMGVPILCYFGWLVMHGWSVVRSAPRQDMFLCPKGHGPLPKNALINFMGEDFCPICFHDKLKQAEQGKL